MMNDEITYIKR